jgi:hypothetical protein
MLQCGLVYFDFYANRSLLVTSRQKKGRKLRSVNEVCLITQPEVVPVANSLCPLLYAYYQSHNFWLIHCEIGRARNSQRLGNWHAGTAYISKPTTKISNIKTLGVDLLPTQPDPRTTSPTRSQDQESELHLIPNPRTGYHIYIS